MCVQEIQNSVKTAEMYDSEPDKPLLDEAKELAGDVSVTVNEIVLVSVLTDKELDKPNKRKKIEAQLKAIKGQSALFGVEIREKMHQRIVTESGSFVLN